MGAPLTAWLARDGVEVIDVPAKLATRVRVLSTGHGRKNDDADALSVGIAALTATRLNTAAVDASIIALRAVVDHREGPATVNRPHVLLTKLVAGGAPTKLTAEGAATPLRGMRPRDLAGKALRGLAVDLVSEIRYLDGRIAKATRDIETAVTVSSSTLAELPGIGVLTAAKILSRVGDIGRFRSAAAFASYTGTAPSRCPPATSCVIGFPEPVIVNSTPACTSWPWSKSAATPMERLTTSARDPKAKAAKRPCAASNADSPTRSTDA
jgi:hypothetical protein